MKRPSLSLAFVLVTSLAWAQLTREIQLAYIPGNHSIRFQGTQDFTGTFLAGMTWSKHLSKKKYAPVAFEIFGGFRGSRSGYKMSAFKPYPVKSYYDQNPVWNIESSLFQYLVGVPVGVELQLRGSPVIAPKNYLAVRMMINNSLLLSSRLNETVDGDFTQSVSIGQYARKYAPAITLELKFLFLTVGTTFQRVTYHLPSNVQKIDDAVGSPFQQAFSHGGKFNDFYTYVGIAFKLKSKRP